MKVLEECIKELVAEAIARKEAEPKRLADLYAGRKDVPMQRPKFKLNEFKMLDSIEEMLTYASRTLEELGSGSARQVFRFSGTKVLKIALNERQGIGQNKAEVGIAANTEISQVVARVFEHDGNFRWIVSEVVKPFQNRNGFETSTGIPWKLFCRAIDDGAQRHSNDLSDEQYAFVDAAINLSETGKLLQGDVLDPSHWGMTADGRTVALDYGYTEEVEKDHYDSDNIDI